MAIYHINTF